MRMRFCVYVQVHTSSDLLANLYGNEILISQHFRAVLQLCYTIFIFFLVIRIALYSLIYPHITYMTMSPVCLRIEQNNYKM